MASSGDAAHSAAPMAAEDTAITSRPWRRDIVTMTDAERGMAMSTTGDHVWDAARHLIDFCESEAGAMGLLTRGATVLELGAGCGFVGMTIARNCATLGRCVVTEMEEGGALEHLQYNVCLNDAILDGRVEVAACDWRECSDDGQQHGEGECTTPGGNIVLDGRWDIVVGSDLVYNEAGVDMLPAVINRLVENGSAVYYCHTKHRYDMMDADFLAALASRGLVADEVRRSGESTPPPSPPPFECLFNEHRLVVWRIRRIDE